MVRDLAAYGLVAGLVVFWLTGFRLLFREPSAGQFGFFRGLAWLAIFLVLFELLSPFVSRTRPGGLHLTYGVFTATLLHFVGGLEQGGWLRGSLKNPPEHVGPYLFWASLVGMLMALRFIATG